MQQSKKKRDTSAATAALRKLWSDPEKRREWSGRMSRAAAERHAAARTTKERLEAAEKRLRDAGME